jgi:hypothetical protein
MGGEIGRMLLLPMLLLLQLLAQQASCGAPPSTIPRDANPLAGLPALPKPHFSWCELLSGLSPSHRTIAAAGCRR